MSGGRQVPAASPCDAPTALRVLAARCVRALNRGSPTRVFRKSCEPDLRGSGAPEGAVLPTTLNGLGFRLQPPGAGILAQDAPPSSAPLRRSDGARQRGTDPHQPRAALPEPRTRGRSDLSKLLAPRSYCRRGGAPGPPGSRLHVRADAQGAAPPRVVAASCRTPLAGMSG